MLESVFLGSGLSLPGYTVDERSGVSSVQTAVSAARLAELGRP